MTDDEQKQETQDESQETTPEGSDAATAGPVAEDAATAGPVAEGDPQAHPPEDSPSTPPADEAAEEQPQDEAPAEEPPAPAPAPAEQKEPDPEDELPWKERRRLQRSRRPHEAQPSRSPEDRQAERRDSRKGRAAQRSKQRAAAKAKKGAAGAGTPPAERDANAAKVRQGIVVSDKAQKSISVRVDIVRRHPTYEKVIRRSRTLHVHDERDEAGEGDTVRVEETRPLSKSKRWRLVEIVEKAK